MSYYKAVSLFIAARINGSSYGLNFRAIKGYKMKTKMLSVAVLIATLTGCAAQTFTVNGDTSNKPTTQDSQTFFISGLGQEQVIDAADICGGSENIIKVEAQHTFVNGLLGFITFGIYTPRDAKVFCNVK
jgi:uncharacterized lipoprotein YajG